MATLTQEQTMQDIRKFAKFKATRVYVITEGMEGGYLPNAVSYYGTKREARAAMVWTASNARDNGYKVTGNARDGYYTLSLERSLDEYIKLSESTIGELWLDVDSIKPIEEVLELLNSCP